MKVLKSLFNKKNQKDTNNRKQKIREYTKEAVTTYQKTLKKLAYM